MTNSKTDKKSSGSNNGKVGKYLTELKELPPEQAEVPEEKKVTPSPPLPKKQVEEKPMVKELKKVETKVNETKEASKSPEPIKATEADIEVIEDSTRLPLSSKDIILGVVNLISVIALIFILTRFTSKSKELSDLKVEELKSETNVSIESGQIAIQQQKADELSELFIDEAGVVEFANQVQSLQGESSSIQGITFANQKPIKDKTGNYGLPVIIQMQGSWEQISNDIQKVDKLPYLFRPASTVIGRSKEDPNVIVFDYGIFLYVNDELGKNR